MLSPAPYWDLLSFVGGRPHRRETGATLPGMPRAVMAALALVTAATLLLRTGIMDSGYWIDEAITVGIASHDLADIPGTLRLDGSPPLFDLLLHGWMGLVGSGEAATRALPLLCALLAVPVSWWAGTAAVSYTHLTLPTTPYV